jgi:hypothetical protein
VIIKDLFRCLDEYPVELHQALAQAWGIDLPRDEPLHTVLRLGEGMLRPGLVEQVVTGLSTPAREALADVMASGGASPARNLSLRHGEIRRFGPAGLRREQPWLHPVSSLEELYYRGLLYRAFGDLGDYVGELLVIPDQLLGRIPDMERRTLADSLVPATLSGAGLPAGEALIEDLMAEMVHLRQQPVRLPANSGFTPELSARLDLGPRLTGAPVSARLHLLWRLLVAQGLVEHDGRQWHLALRARQWLGKLDADQWLSCFLAWRDDHTWDELFDLPTLLCDRDGCPNEPWQVRRRLCTILEGLPEGQWLDLSSVLAGLRRYHPDFLRPDGDMDSWFVRDADTGEFVRGMAGWDAVEGALAAHLITGPLHWLGIVDLGSGDGQDARLFRVSPAGREILAELPPHLDETHALEPLATLDARLLVMVGMRRSRYQRYQLERLAQWQGQDASQARYWLSEDAVWQAQNAGITAEQMLTFLQRITRGRVPEIAAHTLRAWGQRYGGASLRRAVLLETVDAATMQRIRQVPGIAALLGQPLGATRCLVDDDNMDQLVAELKRRNIWPRIGH